MKRKFILVPVILIGILLVTGFVIYRRGLSRLTPKEQIFITLQKLGKLTILPSNDHPELATIVNPDLLRSQSPFYTNARAGDQLIIFPDAKKAYLYRPSSNVIVNSGPLVIQADASPSPSPAVLLTLPSASPKLESLPRVEVRNGTEIVGYAKKIGTQLKEAHYTVTGMNDAAQKNHTETIVVQLDSSVSSQDVQAVATLVNGTITTQLPDGEAPSTAQLLVILGK